MKDKEKKDPLYTRMEIMFILIVPFFITILFGDEFKKASGEHYEVVRYLCLILISALTITYIKYTVSSESIKRNKEVIDILDKGADDRTELFKAYTDTLKEVQRLTKAVKERGWIECNKEKDA